MYSCLTVEPVKYQPSARAIDPLQPGTHVDDTARGGHRFHSEGNPACIEVDPTKNFGMRIVSVDHRDAARHDLAKESGLGPALLQHDFGRESNGRGDVGHERCVEGDAVKAAVRQSLARNFEDSPFAAALDHRSEQRRNAACARRIDPGFMVKSIRGLRSTRHDRCPCASHRPPWGIQLLPGEQRPHHESPATRQVPQRSPAASMIECTINAVIVFPKLPVTPSVTSFREGSPASAWQIRACAAIASGTTTWSRPAKIARPFEHHAGRPAFERLAHEKMAIVTWLRLRGRDENLARLQPAMIVGAARDIPVRTSHELGLGQQPPQADRGNPTLGQTVNEPARHRHPPPCFAFVSLAAVSRGDRTKQTPASWLIREGEQTLVREFRSPLIDHLAAAWIAIKPRPRSFHLLQPFALDASPEEAALLAKPEKKAMPV